MIWRPLASRTRSAAGLCLRAAGSFAAIFVCAAPVLAQESANSPVNSSTGWTFRWIDFAIVALLIAWGFRKAAPAFRARCEEISRKIAEGSRARERAEQQRREAQAKLAGIQDEIARLTKDAERDMEAETQRLRSLARADAEKIEQAARAEIAAAERASRLELKALAARLAAERAEAVVRKQLTPASEAALFRAFVAQIARPGGLAGSPN